MRVKKTRQAQPPLGNRGHEQLGNFMFLHMRVQMFRSLTKAPSRRGGGADEEAAAAGLALGAAGAPAFAFPLVGGIKCFLFQIATQAFV